MLCIASSSRLATERRFGAMPPSTGLIPALAPHARCARGSRAALPTVPGTFGDRAKFRGCRGPCVPPCAGVTRVAGRLRSIVPGTLGERAKFRRRRGPRVRPCAASQESRGGFALLFQEHWGSARNFAGGARFGEVLGARGWRGRASAGQERGPSTPRTVFVTPRAGSVPSRRRTGAAQLVLRVAVSRTFDRGAARYAAAASRLLVHGSIGGYVPGGNSTSCSPARNRSDAHS